MKEGVRLPVVLPSLADIVKAIGPSCSYRYFGPDGPIADRVLRQGM